MLLCVVAGAIKGAFLCWFGCFGWFDVEEEEEEEVVVVGVGTGTEAVVVVFVVVVLGVRDGAGALV